MLEITGYSVAMYVSIGVLAASIGGLIAPRGGLTPRIVLIAILLWPLFCLVTITHLTGAGRARLMIYRLLDKLVGVEKGE